MRKLLGKSVHYSVAGAKKTLNKSPRLKGAIKRVLYTQLGVSFDKDNSAYNVWLNANFPDFISIAQLRKECKTFTYNPIISVVVPTYNTKPEFLRDCIDSVLGQVYENWELCIVDDASPDAGVREIIKEYAAQDKRIKYKFLEKNQHIAGASNTAVELASGEFVALFDHDDLLWPNALFEVVRALNTNKKLDFIYTDEDKITEDRHKHLGAFFKPDWNPDFLHSVNYITHFTTIRKTLLESAGGFGAEYNGAQDWDLFLRLTSMTDQIYHVPKIVYSWRVHDLSTAKHTEAKPYVIEAQRKALTDDLKRKGYNDTVVEQDKVHKGYWKVTYPVQGDPLISIVIPSKNQYKVVKRCIESIYRKSTYKNYEIILVDTGSTDRAVWRWYRKLQKQHKNFHLVEWPEKPFSYARSCNKGAEVAQGELLVMLNNDTEVITPNWLELLAGDAQREEIGAVGCLLFFPDKYHIQHAGVGVGLGGVAANSFSMMTLGQRMSQTQHLMLNTKHDMTVVTAACMMLRKELFMSVGGFDEKFRVSYNDVDLCLRLYEKGYQNLYTPYVRLLHHESISVGLPEEIKKRDTAEFRGAKKLFIKRWKKYVDHDPNLNPNLNKENAFYDV
jgi:O-antigen biosynthesis protein